MTDTLLAFYGAGVGLYPLVFGTVEVSTAIDEMFAKNNCCRMLFVNSMTAMMQTYLQNHCSSKCHHQIDSNRTYHNHAVLILHIAAWPRYFLGEYAPSKLMTPLLHISSSQGLVHWSMDGCRA